MAEEKKPQKPSKPVYKSQGKVGHHKVSRASIASACETMKAAVANDSLPYHLAKQYRRASALQRRCLGHLARQTYA